MEIPRQIRAQVVMRKEVTPGVDPMVGTYTAADIVQAIATSIRYSPPSNEVENTMTAGLMGRVPSILGAQTGGVSFDMWFRGAGAAYDDTPEVVPNIDRPLRATRNGRTFTNPPPASPSSLVYQPSDTEESFTVYLVQDVPGGLAHSIQLTGCVGTHSFRVTAGSGMLWSFTLLGQVEDMADIPYVPGTLITTPGYPRLVSANFQIGATNYAPRFRDLTFNVNQAVVYVPSENAVNGVAGSAVMDRNPRINFDPEVDRQANSLWWVALRDGAPLKDCTFQVGSPTVPWNQIKLRFGASGGAQLQVVSQGLDSRDGILTLPTTLLATLSAGNDDYSYLLDNV
jgi:hypothetical protein